MNLLTNLQTRFPALFRRRKLEAEMEVEIRMHIEMRTRENIEAGMSPPEARYAALRQFGWTESIKEECRDLRRFNWLENFMQDLRYGTRQLRKSPAFTATAVLTLALGIGANTFAFSVLNQVYFQPLPFKDPSGLVRVAVLGRSQDLQKLSFPEFSYLVEHCGSLSSIAAVQAQGLNLTGVDEPSSLLASLVSAGFFETLGIQPVIGRSFVSSEYQTGENHVVLLGYWAWQRHFSGARDVVNRVVELNRESYRVVGVLPFNFRVPVEAGNSEVWLPMALSAQDLQNNNQNVSVVGRLKTGRAIGEAQAEIKVLDARFRETRRVSADLGPLNATILTNQIDRGTSLLLFMLTIAVAFVLLIGCANVTGLSLSRSLTRSKEIAIRLSLGATRQRVLQQLLCEGLLLGLLGGGAGIVLAFSSAGLAASWVGEQARFDRHVLFFSGAISLLAGVVWGLLPAVLSARVSLNNSLKGTVPEQGAFVGAFRSRQLLVVAQVAMSLTLLLGTGLIVRSLLKLALTDPGFDSHRLLSVQVYLPTEKYTNDRDRTAFFGRVFQQLGRTPGVRAAAGTSSFPIYAPSFLRPFRIVGAENAAGDSPSEAEINRTTSSYLRLMEISLAEGRGFTVADGESSEGVAIVDETFKQRFLPAKPAVGTVLSVDADSGVRKMFTIIGVARNVINLGNQYELGRPRPITYVPFGQFAPTTMTILAKTEGPAILLRPELRRLLRRADADLPIRDIRTVEERVHEAGNQSRRMLGVLGVFALSALMWCAIGIFGVVALSVAQRTREISIRMALGAEPGKVQFMFLRQGLILAATGTGLGILGAYALTRQIESVLYGVSRNDLPTHFGAALTVMIVALSATYFPARRAAFVDPARALRGE